MLQKEGIDSFFFKQTKAVGSLATACGSSYAVDAVSTHFEEVILRVNHDKKNK